MNPDVKTGARWLSMAVLCVSAAISAVLFTLYLAVFRTEVPGAPSIDNDWVSIGLYSPANPSGVLDLGTIEIISDVLDLRDYIFWASQQVDVRIDQATVQLNTHFVSDDYLALAAVSIVNSAKGDKVPANLGRGTASALLTESGARKLRLSLQQLPRSVRLGEATLYVEGIVAEGFSGLTSTNPADIFISASLFRKIIFPNRSKTIERDLPVFQLLAKAPRGHNADELTSLLNTSGRWPESPFYANSSDLKYDAYQGVYASPAAARHARATSLISATLSVLIFLGSLVGYCSARLVGEPNLARDFLIRTAMGEDHQHRLYRLLRQTGVETLFILPITLLLGAFALAGLTTTEIYRPLQNMFDANDIALLCALCTLLSLIPSLALFGVKALIGRVLVRGSFYNGLNLNGVSNAALKWLLVFIVALSMSSAIGAISFLVGVHRLQVLPLGFELDQLAFGDFIPRPGHPATEQAGAQEINAALSLASKNSVELATSSCRPFASQDTISFADGPLGQGVAIAICHVSPSFFQTMRMQFIAGETFEVNNRQSVVITEDFIKAFGGNITVGSRILQEALGSDYTVTGIVHPVRLNGPVAVSTPVVFLNGSGFGLQGHYVARIEQLARIQAFGRLLEDVLLVSFNRETLTEGSEAMTGALSDYIAHRDAAMFGGLLALGLCAVSFAMSLGLFIETKKADLALRIALGANCRRLTEYVTSVGIVPVLGGIGLAALASPMIFNIVARLVPIDMVGFIVVVVASGLVAATINLSIAFPAGWRTWQHTSPSILLKN